MLVWVYRDQRVIEISGRALYKAEAGDGERWIHERGVSGDGCIAVERNGMVGCAIDGGGPIRGLPQPLHEDAEIVHDVVLGMPWAQSGILVAYGRSAMAPELPDAPKLVRVPEFVGSSRRNAWRTKITRRYDFQVRCTISFCPVVRTVDDRDAAEATDRYQQWIKAMEALNVRLADVTLKDHEIIGITS